MESKAVKYNFMLSSKANMQQHHHDGQCHNIIAKMLVEGVETQSDYIECNGRKE